MHYLEGHPARPYWHVDAKWVCGIIFTFLLTVIFATAVLATLTRQDVLVPIATSTLENVLGKQNSPADDAGFIADLKSKPGDPVEPIPGQPVTVTKDEINTQNATQLRHTIFERLVTNYYLKGADAPSSEATSSDNSGIFQQASFLRLLNQNTHDLIQHFMMILIWIALLPLLGLIFFSYHSGRLVSPGLILFITALPGTVITKILSIQQLKGSSIPPETVTLIANNLFPLFFWVFLAGAALLVLSIISGIILRIRGKHAKED